MELENQINANTISWTEIRQKGNEEFKEASKDIVTQQFTKIEQNSIEYPTLIYDGPFSETLLQREKVNIPGPRIDQAKAQEIASEFIGKDRVEEVGPAPEGNGDIETWGVYIETKDSGGPLYVAVSKKGGKVISVVSEGGVQKTRLTLKEARERAQSFLEGKGYSNMIPSYEQQYDGTAVINFAYEQDGVIIYPDLIKVKISLENGHILGFEARNYIIAHKERDLEEPSLSLEDAKKLVSPNLNVSTGRLALIPGDSGDEILCYEFKGEYGGEIFIVYINANTGKEENILKIIDTNNGTLVL
jgi:germination protein YpeB